jgi:hypothetical protein
VGAEVDTESQLGQNSGMPHQFNCIVEMPSSNPNIPASTELKVFIVASPKVQIGSCPEVVMACEVGLDMDWRSVDMDKFEAYQRPWPSWVRKNKVDKIKSLDCFSVIHDLIINGMSALQVARQIQMHGEMQDFTEDNVRLYVDHYRATIPKALIMVRKDKKNLVVLQKKVSDVVDAILEINELYKLQKKRIQAQIKREETLGFLMSQTVKEFVEAEHLLQTLFNMRKESGLAKDLVDQAKDVTPLSQDQFLDSLELDKTYNREGLTDLIKNPASRMRILQSVEKFVTLYGKAGLDIERPIQESVARVVHINPEPQEESVAEKKVEEGTAELLFEATEEQKAKAAMGQEIDIFSSLKE